MPLNEEEHFDFLVFIANVWLITTRIHVICVHFGHSGSRAAFAVSAFGIGGSTLLRSWILMGFPK